MSAITTTIQGGSVTLFPPSFSLPARLWKRVHLKMSPFITFTISFMVLFLPLTLLTGCNLDALLLKDMETAFQRQEQKDANVSDVVQKYFPPGMKVSEAIGYLDKRGFKITEFRPDGFRKWPNGELWRYQDESHRKSAGVAGGRTNYTAEKYYDHYLILRLLRKRAVIAIRSDGEQILESRGYVYVDGM